MVSGLRRNRLLGAGDKVGLLGNGDNGAGGCGAGTVGSGTSMEVSTSLSSLSIAGLGGQALLSTGGGALPCTGAAGPTGALGTQKSGLAPLYRGDFSVGLKFLKYRRFLSVTLPEPSTLTEYLSKPRSSSTTPVLSKVTGCFLFLDKYVLA